MARKNNGKQHKRIKMASSSSSDESTKATKQPRQEEAELASSSRSKVATSSPSSSASCNVANDGSDADSTESEDEGVNVTRRRRKGKKISPKKTRTLSSEDEDQAGISDQKKKRKCGANIEPIPGSSNFTTNSTNSNGSTSRSQIYGSPEKLKNCSPNGTTFRRASDNEDSESNMDISSAKVHQRGIHDMTTLCLPIPAGENGEVMDFDNDSLDRQSEDSNNDDNGFGAREYPEENGIAQEPHQSSSSSDSDTDEEAQHSFRSASSNSSMDSDTLAARVVIPDEVPLLNMNLYQHHSSRCQLKLFSSTEFSFRMYVEHYQTSNQIEQYTRQLVEAFQSMDCYFHLGINSFIFPIKKPLYSGVLNALMRTVGLNKKDDENTRSFEYVVRALSRYRSLNTHPVEVALRSLQSLRGFSDLKSYQLESIQFAASRSGRVMIADQPGMGKTAVAIMTSLMYKKEWPLLILCSRNLQPHWSTELQKWLPEGNNVLSLEDCVQYKEFMEADDSSDVVVITYSLLQKLKKEHKEENLKQKNFKVLILDNSEKIKHNWTSTSKSVRGLIKRAKRRIFISSNPAYGVPVELFRQLRRIDHKAFDGGNEFAGRYCGSSANLVEEYGPSRPLTSTNWRYARNLEELKLLLFSTVAIRHFRSQHFDIPMKNRERVLLEFNPGTNTRTVLEDILQFRDSMDFSALVDLPSRQSPDAGGNKYIFKWYKLSAFAKIPLIWQWLDQFDMSEKKVIIYYRHKCMMEGVREYLRSKKIAYIRIRTPRNEEELTKKERCEKFNNDPNIRVALMNIEIPSVDVDLSAADTIIFTELYWVPDSIFKNENRACAPLFMGQQKKLIDVKYLVANDVVSADSIHIDKLLWETMLGKMNILFNLGLILAEDNFVDFNFDTDFVPDPSWNLLVQGNPTPSLLGDDIDLDYEPESETEVEDDDDGDLSEVNSEEFSDNPESPNDSDDNDDDDNASGGGIADSGPHDHSSQDQSTSTPASSQEEVPGHSHERLELESESDNATGGPSTRTRHRSKETAVLPSEGGHASDEVETESGSDDETFMNYRQPGREVYKSIALGSDDSDEEEDDDPPSSSLENFVVPSSQDEDYDPDYVPPGERRRHRNDDESEVESSQETCQNSPDEDREESDSSSEDEPKTNVSKMAKSFLF